MQENLDILPYCLIEDSWNHTFPSEMLPWASLQIKEFYTFLKNNWVNSQVLKTLITIYYFCSSIFRYSKDTLLFIPNQWISTWHMCPWTFSIVRFEWHSNPLPSLTQKGRFELQLYLLKTKQAPDGYDSLCYFLDGTESQMGSCEKEIRKTEWEKLGSYNL